MNRLLACYPPINSDDHEQVLRNYVLAVDDYDAQDVEAAVDAFIKGSAPGVNASFLPPSPAVGAECRRQMNIRQRHEELVRVSRPALPPPDIEHAPESRSAVGGMVKQAVANLKSVDEKAETEADKRRAEHWEKVNNRFRPDMSDEAIRQRLIVTSMGFDVGDEDGRDD